MHAVVIDAFGEPGTLREMPVLEPAAKQVLVKVNVAGVNPADWKAREGKSGDHKMPLVLGQDFAGTVAWFGDGVADFTPGERVFGIARTFGGYAEYTIALPDVHAEPIATIPTGVTDEQAAALPTPGLTALASLEMLGVGKGTTLLVHGAAGAVGMIATQLAHARGAHVIGTIKGGSADSVRSLGVGDVIDSETTDVVASVKELAREGIDAVLDLVSADAEANAVFADVLRPGGALVSTNHIANVELFTARGLTATNISMNKTPQSSPESLLQLARMVADGSLVVRIAGRRPIARAAEVLDEGESGQLQGKVVLRVAESTTTD
jgi:NADPH:quinone reductase-like Zn-dependent oxidoreductase